MAIRYTCRCGANIRMPVSATGKKARCQSCGAIFTVPSPDYDPDEQPIPLEGSDSSDHAPSTEDQAAGGWLTEFAHDEKKTGNPSPVMVLDIAPPSGQEDAEREAAAQEEAKTALPRITPRLPHEQNRFHDVDRSGVIEPDIPFWKDLLRSFGFFAEPSNLVTYLVLPCGLFATLWIPLLGPFFKLVLLLYIAAFYMAIVRETASGEDHLPEVVWMSSPFDLVMPLVHFLGVTALAMLPAAVYVLSTFHGEGFWEFLAHVMQAPDLPAVKGLTILGLLFWPVMILAVAIGGGFRGLWPHKMIWTVLRAPLPYLAVCVTLIVAIGIWYVPHLSIVQAAAGKLGQRGVPLFIFLGDLIGIYGMIVAMRTIGLFYRHYKHRFPWAAE